MRGEESSRSARHEAHETRRSDVLDWSTGRKMEIQRTTHRLVSTSCAQNGRAQDRLLRHTPFSREKTEGPDMRPRIIL